MTNGDFGFTLQKIICDTYNLDINDTARKQIDAQYNDSYVRKLLPCVEKIFTLMAKPVEFLTFNKECNKLSPHNFLLEDGKTLSIRTIKSSNRVAPRIIGQAGYPVINEFFKEIYGKQIENKDDIKSLCFDYIHQIFPVFIEKLFLSDYTVFILFDDPDKLCVISSDEVEQYSFERDDFSFSRVPEDKAKLSDKVWKESTTLYYHGISVAEIQVHKNRTFKFRFKVSSIPVWFIKVKETTETLGISAEAAICKYFNLKQPKSFTHRAKLSLINALFPIIDEAFKILPNAVKHSGSDKGDRGGRSKSSYDFLLDGDQTLSLKTNTGNKICPPEVGQPGTKTVLLYFKDFFEEGLVALNSSLFKKMVFEHINEIMPIYLKHLFDSDWLLWIYKIKGGFEFKVINQSDISSIVWNKDEFSFTKNTIDEWNESNTVKYKTLSIGEFQVHKSRACYKFRFIMPNLLKILKY